jgi:hypothetical protein
MVGSLAYGAAVASGRGCCCRCLKVYPVQVAKKLRVRGAGPRPASSTLWWRIWTGARHCVVSSTGMHKLHVLPVSF